MNLFIILVFKIIWLFYDNEFVIIMCINFDIIEYMFFKDCWKEIMFLVILVIFFIVIDLDEIVLEIFVKNLFFFDWGIKSIFCIVF